MKRAVLSSMLNLSWSGRSGCMTFRTPRSRLPFGICGIHGAHGEAVEESFSDLWCMLRGFSTEAPDCVVGDTNTDLLPVQHNDIFAHVRRRNQHHTFQCYVLSNWLEANHARSLHVIESSVVLNAPCEEFAKYSFCPITLRPIGDQSGLPSLIDYAISDCACFGSIDWRSAPADHALVACRAQVPVLNVSAPRRSTWQCTNPDEFCVAINKWELHPDTSYVGFARHLHSYQERYQSKYSCRQLSKRRMPFLLRSAIHQMKTVKGVADYIMWRKRRYLYRSQWIKELHDKRLLARAKKENRSTR